jgi:hypothetical protein
MAIFFVQNMAFCVKNTQYKSCDTCKWFNLNEVRSEYGLCTLFKEKIYIADQERLISNFAKHCRSNEHLCGKEGRMHDNKESDITMEEKLKNFEEQYNNIMDKYNDSSNTGHGEVTEKPELDTLNTLDDEIEKFTKEGLELLFKVKKFNKRKISIALDRVHPKWDKFTKY